MRWEAANKSTLLPFSQSRGLICVVRGHPICDPVNCPLESKQRRALPSSMSVSDMNGFCLKVMLKAQSVKAGWDSDPLVNKVVV